jgi:hypothetical protein
MFQGIQKEALETGENRRNKNLTGDVSTLANIHDTGIFVSPALLFWLTNAIMFFKSQPFVSIVQRGSMGQESLIRGFLECRVRML